MHFTIDPKSATPIYEQIIAQVIYFIASGAIEPGESIPSVREFHNQWMVNPNTVARAYQVLAEKGIVEAKRGLGMEVTAEAPAICRSERKQIVRKHLANALREAVASSLPVDEIERLVTEELNRVNGQRGRG